MHSSSDPQLLTSRILSLGTKNNGIDTAFEVLATPVTPGTLDYYIPAMSLVISSIATKGAATASIALSQRQVEKLRQTIASNPELEKILYQREELFCISKFSRATYLPFLLSVSPDPQALWTNILQHRPEFQFNAKATVAGWFNVMNKDNHAVTGNSFLNQSMVDTIKALVSPEFFKRWAYAIGMVSFGRTPHYLDEFKNSRYAIGRTLIHEVMPLFLSGFDVKEMITGSFKKYKSSELTLDWLRGMEALQDETLKSPYSMDDRRRLSRELLTVFMPYLFDSGYSTSKQADARVDSFLTSLFNEGSLDKKMFIQWLDDRAATIQEPGFFQAHVTQHLEHEDSWEIVRHFKTKLPQEKIQMLNDFEAIAFMYLCDHEHLVNKTCEMLSPHELQLIKESIIAKPSYFSVLTSQHPVIREFLKDDDIKEALLVKVLNWAVLSHQYNHSALPMVGGLLPPFDYLDAVFPELNSQWRKISNQMIDVSKEDIFKTYSSGAPHQYTPFVMNEQLRVNIANELGNVFFKGMNLANAISAQKALDIPFVAKDTVRLAMSCLPKNQQHLNFDDFNIDFNLG